MSPAEIKFKPVIYQVDTQAQKEDHQGYLPFHEDGQTHKDTRPQDIIQLAFLYSGMIEAIPFPMIEDKIIDGQKGKEVEPGVDDARLEIHIREEGAPIG